MTSIIHFCLNKLFSSARVLTNQRIIGQVSGIHWGIFAQIIGASLTRLHCSMHLWNGGVYKGFYRANHNKPPLTCHSFILYVHMFESKPHRRRGTASGWAHFLAIIVIIQLRTSWEV